MKPVIFDAEAEDEFGAAVKYYERQREELGTEFEHAVEQAISRIAQNPGQFPTHGDRGIRKCLLKRFPYTIFFLELDECIWIAAVAHQKRRPGYWASRWPE
jgi:toxin ParE1/3/4